MIVVGPSVGVPHPSNSVDGRISSVNEPRRLIDELAGLTTVDDLQRTASCSGYADVVGDRPGQRTTPLSPSTFTALTLTKYPVAVRVAVEAVALARNTWRGSQHRLR